MFKSGHYYLERVTTGKLTFKEEDGTPSVSATKRGSVYNFHNQNTANELLEKLPQLAAADLLPGSTYMRLFKAPEPSFDSRGELIQPRFQTKCFFEVSDELSNIARHRSNTFDLCDALCPAVLALFDEVEQVACPLVPAR